MKQSSKNMGTPTVMVVYTHGSPEKVRQNRQQMEDALSQIVSRQEGLPVSAKINWDDGKPSWYGRDYIQHGDERIFLDETDPSQLPQWAEEILSISEGVHTERAAI